LISLPGGRRSAGLPPAGAPIRSRRPLTAARSAAAAEMSTCQAACHARDYARQDGGRHRIARDCDRKRAAGLPRKPHRRAMAGPSERRKETFAEIPAWLSRCIGYSGKPYLRFGQVPAPSDPVLTPKVSYESERFGRVPVQICAHG
jgi:hypothetical protein